MTFIEEEKAVNPLHISAQALFECQKNTQEILLRYKEEIRETLIQLVADEISIGRKEGDPPTSHLTSLHNRLLAFIDKE